MISTGIYLNLHSDISVPVNKSFSKFPVNNNSWRMISQIFFNEQELKILKPTDYIYRLYADTYDNRVYLYIGYHGGGENVGVIHSPKHCLPGSGWYKMKNNKISLDVGNKKIYIVKAIYQKSEEKTLFLYWYHVKGDSLTDDYSLRLSMILNSILYRRKDSAFIRVSVPFEIDEEKAFSVGTQFIEDFYPIIREFLPE